MPFTVKDWKDDPDHTTPINAAALEDLETRLSGYTDTTAAGVVTLAPSTSARNVIQPTAAGQVGLSIKAPVGAGAGDAVSRWQNSGGSDLARVNASGYVEAVGAHDRNQTNAYVTFEGLGTGPGAIARSAGQVPWTIKGAAAHTANLFEVQNSAAYVLGAVKASGAHRFKHGVWHDTEDGKERLWFTLDATNYYKSGSDSGDAHAFRGLANTDLAKITAAGQLQLPVQGSGGGLLIGGDAAIWRSNADQIAVEGFVAQQPAYLQGWMTRVDGTLVLGSAEDAQISRSAANELTIPDRLVVTSPAAASNAILAKGAASQSAAIFQVQNSASGDLAWIDAAGTFRSYGSLLSVGSGLHTWKDGTPSKAAAVQMKPEGGAVTDDLIFSMYDGSAWAERARLTNDGGFEMPERSDGAAPAANKGRFFFRDNGSGKTQFVVRFPTGAIQVLSTEP